MTPSWRLVLVWLAACTVSAIAGLGLLSIMVSDAPVNWSTEIPRRAMTVPMICVIVFWGVVRAAGVRLEPLRTFTFGGLAVYLALFVVGRVLSSVAVGPRVAMLSMLAALMALGWSAVWRADRRGEADRRPRG